MAKKIDIQLNLKTNGAGQIQGLTLDLEDFQRAVQTAARVANTAVKEMDKHWYDSITRVSATCATFGTAMEHLQKSLADLSGDYKDFDKAMRLANTMAGKDAAGFDALKAQITSLAKEIPLTRDALANGLYQVVSNGVPEDNWIDYLNKSAHAAVGGAADLGQVVGVTSTIIKNYGLSWDAAGVIQDKIQLTAKNGVTSFEQLAAALPRVTGNAATLGVSIEELLATFATLTGVSGNTAEVSTQLAAIFTALVKPSSEATKMAAKMGMQFDAAAIKAAGGMQKFLQSLDTSVKSYAAASGMLEQEVYGKLFGSAESLRALVPLQGELADKFKQNAAEMADSAGVIDAAFKQNIATEESKLQLVKNKLSLLYDISGRMAASIQPYLQYLAITGQATTGVIALGNALRVLALRGIVLRQLRNLMVAYSMSCEVGTRSTFLLKTGLKSLMIASGIGVAIMAVTTALEYFSRRSEEAKAKAEALARAEEAAKQSAEALKEQRRQNAVEVEKVRVAIEQYIVRIKEFKGSQEEEHRLVKELNSAYGDAMGYKKTLSEWYSALVTNSKAYCKQLALEAEAQLLAQQIAEKRVQAREIIYNADGSGRKYSSKREQRRYTLEEGKNLGLQLVEGDAPIHDPGSGRILYNFEITGTSDLDKANKGVKQLNTEVAALQHQLEKTVDASNKIKLEFSGSKTNPFAGENDDKDNNDKKTQKQWIENAKTLEQYSNNLQVVDAKLRELDPSQIEEVARLREQRQEIERQITALQILLGLKEASVRHSLDAPKELNIPTSQKSFAPEPPSARPADLQLSSGVYEMAADSINKYIAAVSAAATQNQLLQGSVANIGSAMGSLGQAIGGAAGAWLEYAANTLSAVSAVLPQILALTNAKFGQAMAEATSSSAGLPFPFNIISIGAGVAAVIAAMAKVPKFADGGIAYGPTLGLFGEYAGASSNPEVVAPLSELSKLLQPAVPVAGGEVRVRIAGRDLVGVLDLQRNYNSRI